MHLHISWTDDQGLVAVEARYGAFAARHIPIYGPIVLTHMISIGEPFRSVNIVRLMQQLECPTFTEAKCHDIVMQVIRYINYSDMTYYVQQRRVQKTYMWFLFSIEADKSIYREQDEARAAKSRNVIIRQATIVRPEVNHNTGRSVLVPSTPTRSRPQTQEYVPPITATMQQIHYNWLAAAFTKYLDGMKMPIELLSSDRMWQIYISPGFTELMSEDQRDQLTMFTKEQLIASFTTVADMMINESHGTNSALANPDGSLDL